MIPIARPDIGADEQRAVEEVLKSGNLAQGERVKEFEEAFSSYTGTERAVAASSGTTALHLAMLSCGIGPGDEVITTPFSFIASANSILYCGAKPVFADIDKRTYNIDPEKVEEKISEKTKALLIVHLYGQPCEMDRLLELSNKNNLRLIEDACQAHGAAYRGQRVGFFGDCGVFSFYPTKNMTTGEGGMVTTNSLEISEKAVLLREHGSKVKYSHEILGYNYRMTDIAAAIGLVQLKKLDIQNAQRRKNAARLTDGVGEINGIEPPYLMPGVEHVFNQYTIRFTEDFHISRDEASKRLLEKEIGTGIYYPVPIHRQPFYRGESSSLGVSEKAADQVLSLPVHPSLSEEDLGYICQAVREL